MCNARPALRTAGIHADPLPAGKALVAYTRRPEGTVGPGVGVRIVLNHNPEDFPGETLSIRKILDLKGWSFPLIIARVDGTLVERKDWDSAVVRDGAEVDLHHLVSGG